jgi:hypothetical protein
MSNDNVVSFDEEQRKRHLIIFPVEEGDPHDPVRWAIEALRKTTEMLDGGDGYNKLREVHEGHHEGNLSYLEEHAEYLEVYLQERESEEA